MPDTLPKDVAESEESVLRRAIQSLRETGRQDMMFWAEALEDELATIPLEAQAFGERLSMQNPAVHYIVIGGCPLPNIPPAWILLWRVILTANLRNWAQRIFAGQSDWREFACLFDLEGG